MAYKKKVKERMYICSCSFGKDSIATILLALEHNEPLDRVVFCEVMFDNDRGISGEMPEHIEWVYNVAMPKLESMGVKVDIVRGEMDYMDNFFREHKSGDRMGKRLGFPMGSRCVIQNQCKIRPMKRFLHQFIKDYKIVTYLGIAIDEPERLKRLDSEKEISLLEKYGYTEQMCMDLCREYGLLSPIYENGVRNGCWFCPNSRITSMARLKVKHPELWGEL